MKRFLKVGNEDFQRRFILDSLSNSVGEIPSLSRIIWERDFFHQRHLWYNPFFVMSGKMSVNVALQRSYIVF